jgi:hypothetical protein
MTKNRWRNCVQTGISRCKIKNWKKSLKAELIGRSPPRRRRSALDCVPRNDDDHDDNNNNKSWNVITELICGLREPISFICGCS